jgi:hypothetical protein
VVEQELAFSNRALTRMPPGRTPFSASTVAPAHAPAIDRLAALLGRDVTGAGS